MINLPQIPQTLNSGQNNLVKELYEPCLSWAKYYDRGVGYFSSGWIRVNALGMATFASRGGKARWLTSPILSSDDLDAIRDGNASNINFEYIIKENINELKKVLENDVLSTLAWMVYDGIIEFRFAVPTKILAGGDFHDKFGIFRDDFGNMLSFNGSVNDSQKGMVNYESIKVFTSWNGLEFYVKDDQNRFERLWNNDEENVSVFTMSEGLKSEIFQLRADERPYELNESNNTNKWIHQEKALQAFIKHGNGILEMATGTGKTRTAIKIMNYLFNHRQIKHVVITMAGTDLLDQWYKEVMLMENVRVYRYYEKYKELITFGRDVNNSILLVSRTNDFLEEAINYFNTLKKNVKDEWLLICDEVHGMGSKHLVENLTGKLKNFKYRLGLSATPEREYDEEGTRFITSEIGGVIYSFGIEDAIKKGILCEFEYLPLFYELTQEDKNSMKSLISSFHSKKASGEKVYEEDLYRELARIKKLSPAKLPIFKNLIDSKPYILDRSIIFVETREFGEEVQKILIKYRSDYHTYYGQDDRQNLTRFSEKELNCLLTCERISEGIDIKSVYNIILFSADRAKLQTIQRIGRSLRLDPNNENKKSTIVDFVKIEDRSNLGQEDSDNERYQWLEKLSKIRIGGIT